MSREADKESPRLVKADEAKRGSVPELAATSSTGAPDTAHMRSNMLEYGWYHG